MMTEGVRLAGSAARAAFGRRVRGLRLARGLSQEKLAELADLHRTYVSSLDVSLENIHALARGLGVRPHELFDGED
jgi:transcriptional regulator with XRE-family HTH domain